MVGFDVTRKNGKVHFIRRQLTQKVQTFCGKEIKWRTNFKDDAICPECAEVTGYEEFEEIVIWDG